MFKYIPRTLADFPSKSVQKMQNKYVDAAHSLNTPVLA